VRGSSIIIVGVLAAACGRERLENATGDLEVLPLELDFGKQYIGGNAEHPIELINRGVISETVALSIGAGPFTLASASLPAAGGSTLPVPLTFAPKSPGPASGTLHVSWSSGSADVALTGEGLAWPACDSSDPCSTSRFDPQSGRCLTDALPDGTACVAADACLTATVCVAGFCVGQARDCDDGNACTVDSCSQTSGCVHTAGTAQCKGDDPCKAYACDPQLGCVGSPVADGTVCNTGETCRQSGVCTSGACLAMPKPDGSACTLEWAPCVSDATCTSGVCGSPTADGLTPGQTIWSWGSDAGIYETNDRRLLAVDDDGNSYVGDWNSDALTSLDICGRVRWGTQLYGAPYSAMIDGTQLLIQENGVFSAISLADGHRIWTVDDAKLFGFCPDGGSCGYSLGGGMLFAAPALTNSGQIYLSSSVVGPPWSLQLASLEQNGTVDWVRPTGIDLQYTTEAAQVVDSAGHLWAYVAGDTANNLWSFDTTGNARFNVATFTQQDLAIGPGFIVNMGAQPSAALDFTGATSFTLNFGSPTFNSSAVIDDLGNITYWPNASTNFNPGFQRLRFDGTPLKSVVVPSGFAVGELALDAAGRVYVMGFGTSNSTHLWCWDGSSATLDFDVDLSATLGLGPTSSPSFDYSLFVSHGMVLNEFNGQAVGIFAGKKALQAKRAWWSRGYGGANDNRHSPPF
jgi:hypothetical protein